MASEVYFTSDISSEGLLNLYDYCDGFLIDDVAVKMSTGEPPHSNYLRPELIGDLIQSIGGTIVECNTAYEGERNTTESHEKVIQDHELTSVADVDIMDSEGEIPLKVPGTPYHISTDYVGSGFTDYTDWLILSHFKGHEMAGYGGALKNVAIGIASSKGKSWIHSAGQSIDPVGFDSKYDTNDFLESMADACAAVMNAFEGDVLYINVMNNLSVDCDCNGNPKKPKIADIGILASTDPVALDQACIDLIYEAEGNKDFIERLESLNGVHLIECCEEIGLGTRDYDLINIDE